MKSPIIHHAILLLILLGITAGFVSCRPRGILHSWEMREVMVDLHKTDALIQLSGLQYGHSEECAIYYAQVLEKHGITQAQFDSSLVWYTAHPKLFDKIYPKVLTQLKEEEEQFLALHEAELECETIPVAPAPTLPLTPIQKDSIIWVTVNGYPSSWNPLMHDLENQLLPKVCVLR